MGSIHTYYIGYDERGAEHPVLEGEGGFDQDTPCTRLRHSKNTYKGLFIFMFVSACMEVLCAHLGSSVARGHLIP